MIKENMNDSEITVIMPVYNSEKYLQQAIESILDQTYKEFSFIIINDGSSDTSAKIIKKFTDTRILYIENKANKGIVYSLNKGLELAKSKYIVRMDADDICEKNRLKIQYEYMEKNTDVWLLGCSAYKIDKDGKRIGELCPSNESENIKTMLLFNNPIIHPSVMLRRKEALNYCSKYESKHVASEDYGMWCKLASSDGRIEILPEKLMNYRVSEGSITANARKEKMLDGYLDIYSTMLKALGVPVTKEEVLCHCSFARGYDEKKDIDQFIQIEKKIESALKKRTDFNVDLFEQIVIGFIRGYAIKNHIRILDIYRYIKNYNTEIGIRLIQEILHVYGSKIKRRRGNEQQ